MNDNEYIYVAKGAGGLLKVGRTRDPKARRVALMQAFRLRGDQLVTFQVSEPTDVWWAEKELIRAVGERLPRADGWEWFRDGWLIEDAHQLLAEVVEYVREVLKEYEREDAVFREAISNWYAYPAPQSAVRTPSPPFD